MIIDEKYQIGGMSCAACSARVDKAVRSLKGVKEVNVNLLTNSMIVSYDEKQANEAKIVKSVEKAGYSASKLETSNVISNLKTQLEDSQTPRLLKRLIISLVLLVPLFYLAMGYMLSWPIGLLRENLYVLAIIEMVLSLIIIFVNHKFFTSGFKAIIHLSPNMDTLVALGSSVAFIYSLVMSVILFVQTGNGVSSDMLNMTMMNISFETAGMVPTLITIGKTLESYSKGKTTNSIKALLDLSPKTAIVIRDNKEISIPVEEVRIDDIFVVKPGMSVPVDGEIMSGFSNIDESMLTGESIPVDKEKGSLVKSGTINQNGTITCRAIRVGESTTLNQIIQSVEKAANSKAKISKIADKVSGIFVPIVIGLSLLTFVCWLIFGGEFVSSHTDIHSSLLSYSIERGIAILVISCPCALGLATPVAIMVGSGKGARNGILFKNAEAIEEAGKVSFVVFDKTGTITIGKPVVDKIVSFIDEKEFIQLAYSLENKSSHPLANAVNEHAKSLGISPLEIDDFSTVQGKGIIGKIHGEKLLAGNAKFIQENSLNLDKISDEISELSKQGKSILIFAKESRIVGYIAVSDQIKEDSAKAINMIKNLGIIPIMLSGDNSYTSNYIASQVGIDYVFSEVLPEGKLDIIERLKHYGKVMMVGDGINDAIALTSADVGVAISSGNDIAIDSASVVLMKSTLIDAYAAIRLSQNVYLNIKENLFWAFIYNLVMIPIAAGAFSALGLYKVAPWMGSAAMALSSVFVVTNALRINLFKPYKAKSRKQKISIPEELANINNCDIKEENEMEKTYKIEGMMCIHCVARVKDALLHVKGVDAVDVSLEKGTARVSSKKVISDKDIVKAVTKAGYKVK